MKISLRVEIFKEEDSYVALSPELNVSSFGETIEDAKRSVREALEAFIEQCESMGTLEDVLEASGFTEGSRPLQKDGGQASPMRISARCRYDRDDYIN